MSLQNISEFYLNTSGCLHMNSNLLVFCDQENKYSFDGKIPSIHMKVTHQNYMFAVMFALPAVIYH